MTSMEEREAWRQLAENVLTAAKAEIERRSASGTSEIEQEKKNDIETSTETEKVE